MVDLSIIIVSWNTRQFLQECLESLYRHTKGIAFEVFVVDNNSSDASPEMVRAIFPQVNVIANDDNAGFSKANNQAIRISQGRYIALLNPDTLLTEDVFSPLIIYADQHEKIGAIGPKIYCRDGKTIQYSCAKKLPKLYFAFCSAARLSSLSKIFDGANMAYWDHEDSRYVEALCGACMVVRKSAIDDVGLMDENQFMYFDETDWCKRFRDSGWRNYYYADASIIHYGGESSQQVWQRVNFQYLKAERYYYRKHHGEMYAFAYCAQIGLFALPGYIYTLLFRAKNERRREIMDDYRSLMTWVLKNTIGR